MITPSTTFFAPQLFIPAGVKDLSFYERAFGAIEIMRLTNDDGSVHVAEFSIDGTLFHVHEEKVSAGHFNPARINGITALIGLFVPDVDKVMLSAINVGGIVVSPAQSYDYGYRQGEVRDPFGHVWMIEMKI